MKGGCLRKSVKMHQGRKRNLLPQIWEEEGGGKKMNEFWRLFHRKKWRQFRPEITLKVVFTL